jgi:predicted AAA+ superfamily ATPase
MTMAIDYRRRNLIQLISETAKTRPLIYLNGPRQTGKSTLAKNISLIKKTNYISLDMPHILAAAKSDPARFIESLPGDCLNIIDEIQKTPEVFPYLKIAVDKSRRHGSAAELYLLTGSANLLALPQLSEALVGRMSV